MKKTVAKVLVLSFILGPVAFLTGCHCAKKCGEPVMNDRLHKMERERCGEK